MKINTNPVADIEEIQEFLTRAERDGSARAGDPWGHRTPLLDMFASAEWDLIAKLRELVTTDEDAREFVRRWRDRVETSAPDEFPQRRGAVFASNDEMTWTIPL